MAVTREDLVLDPWAGLSHRPILNPKSGSGGNLAPTWVGVQGSSDVRRLNAYIVLRTYIDNCSRLFLQDLSRQREHREYGDAALMVDAILAALLGEDMTVSVDGADAEKPEPPTSATGQQNVDPGSVEDVRVDSENDDDPDEGVGATKQAEYVEDLAEWEKATVRQEWLDEWVRKERFLLKIQETERNAVQLGDGVYMLSWNNQKKRVRLRIYDPGFYFPVLDQDDDDEFPDRVHLAWEYDDADGKCWVRRITFERVSLIDAQARGVTFAVEPTVGTDGALNRQYPYQDDDDSDDSEYVALMTDASWPKASLKFGPRGGVDSFSYEGATFATNGDGQTLRDFDLGVDFIPVVHVPNTIAGLEHFGIASLTRIAQILDDLAASDTDMQAASAIVGAPPISFENPSMSSVETKTYGPGTAYYGGKVTIADTSRSLDALLKLIEQLMQRVQVNGRVPAEVLGAVKAANISSGIQLALSFGPFRSLVNGMRLVRDDKYALLFKMVQRMSIVAGTAGVKQIIGGALDPTAEVLDVAVKFGSYLPNDLKGTVDIILSLLKDHAISRSTALRMLQEAGLDIRDMKDELEAIEGEDFLGALKLAEAVADETAARAYLHLPEVPPRELIPPAVRGGTVVPDLPNAPTPNVGNRPAPAPVGPAAPAPVAVPPPAPRTR